MLIFPHIMSPQGRPRLASAAAAGGKYRFFTVISNLQIVTGG
jgi:hypothetical protein